MTHNAANSLILSMADPENSSGVKLAPSDNFWLPNAGTELAQSIDDLFMFIMWVSVISVAGVFAAMIWFCIRYKATSREANESALSQEDHSNVLEATWSLAPLVFVIAFFVWGFRDFVALRTAPKDSLEIVATGQKWNWTFKYPNGHVDSELHAPQGRNVRILIKSVDVLHSLFIPEFRVKMDAVPGRYTDLWFNATGSGEFPVFCAEYCGTSHSDMITKAVIHEGDGYGKWLKAMEAKLDQMPPVELGELMYKQFGCGACHTIDGKPKVGPTFKGLFGKSEALSTGDSVTVDENYIRTSILEPQKDIVQGYPASMPSFKGQMSDKKIDGLIAYIKSLK